MMGLDHFKYGYKRSYTYILFSISQRHRIYLIILFTLTNFILGLIVISSTFLIVDKQTTQSLLNVTQENRITQLPLFTKTRRPLKQSYNHYFRIDYNINQAVCKSIGIFNSTTTITSIQDLTNVKLNQLFTEGHVVNIDIISIKPILKKTYNIRENSIYKSPKRTVCDYVLEIYTGLDFPSNCDETCQSRHIQRLTSNIEPFANQINDSFVFIVYPTNSTTSKFKFHIQQVYIYRSSEYYDKLVYIRSFYEDRYVSALIVDSDSHHTSVTMTTKDRSLFLISDGLHPNTDRNDCSTIYVSFSTQNIFLRHEDGRIKLGKNDQSFLLKQDATFKLIKSKTKGDMIALESINLPRSYIAVDQDSHAALVLEKLAEEPQIIDQLDRRFLFKLSFNE